MKTKNVLILLLCASIIGCTKRLDVKTAAEVCIKAFGIIDYNRVSVVGISEDLPQTYIVIFRIKSRVDLSEIEIFTKLRKYNSGWRIEGIKNQLGMYINADDTIKKYQIIEERKLYAYIQTKKAKMEMEKISEGINNYINDNATAPYASGCEMKSLYSALGSKYSSNLPKNAIEEGIYSYLSGYKLDYDKLSLRIFDLGEMLKMGIRVEKKTDYLLYVGIDSNPDSEDISDFYNCVNSEKWRYYEALPAQGIFAVRDIAQLHLTNLIIFNGKWIRAPKFEFEKQ
jgi:hypothetical protein